MKKNRVKLKYQGFLLVEVLISAFILASAVALSMYLFRMGFVYLEKTREINLISSKVPQVIAYLNKVADFSKGKEEIRLGEDILLVWEAKRIEKIKPGVSLSEGGVVYPYELELYEVKYTIKTEKREKNYKTYVVRYKMLFNPLETM